MNVRHCILLVIMTAGISATCFMDPFPQVQTYHLFADQRSAFNLSRFMDVVSNVGFLLAGILGLLQIKRTRSLPTPLQHWLQYYSLSLIFVAAGSAWYHHAPSNHSLIWDRLPMTVSFSFFFALITATHLSLAFAKKILPMLLLIGIGVTTYWYLTELRGEGDLRFYAAFQFLGLGLACLIMTMFPARLLNKTPLVMTVLLYLLAKGFESADTLLFEFTQTISGHTLKHLISALGAYCVIQSVPVQYASAHQSTFPECETGR